ncbi:MAG: hypothetical protein QME45_09195 [Clostridiales bacterium]|nr:hypothetical protein [Clostridiales bacterium]
MDRMTKSKFESMTKKEKAAYIWDYYKWHIIIGIIVIALVANLITSITTRKDTILDVTLLGKYIDSNKQDAFKKTLDKKFVTNIKKQETQVEFLFYDKNSKDQMAIASIQKFQALAASASLDVVVLDKDDFNLYAGQGLFMELDKIPELSNLSSKFVSPSGDQNTSKAPLGITADDVKVLKDLGYDTQNKIITIASNTKHKQNAINFIKYIFE